MYFQTNLSLIDKKEQDRRISGDFTAVCKYNWQSFLTSVYNHQLNIEQEETSENLNWLSLNLQLHLFPVQMSFLGQEVDAC